MKEFVLDKYIDEQFYKKRVVRLFNSLGIGSITAMDVTAQLILLDEHSHDKPITIYIDSPGGMVAQGLAIYDVMQSIKSPIKTICFGEAASMAAILLSAGQKGMRYIFPNSYVLLHQPSGGIKGQASDIDIHAKEISRVKTVLNNILSKHTGQSLRKISKDVERDHILTAEAAKEYGVVDRIIGHDIRYKDAMK